MSIQNQIRVVVADDHRFLHDLLRSVLGREENIRIVGEAANRIQLMSVMDNHKPQTAYD